nr:Gag-Asp_proteas domain-containing protein [Tanacetum cinerariifolium]
MLRERKWEEEYIENTLSTCRMIQATPSVCVERDFIQSGSTVIDENKGRDDMRQQTKKRGTSKDVVESFDQRVSTLHQVTEDLQADMALCKRSLASGSRNTNHGPKSDVPKPSPFMGKREARATSYKSGGCFICDGPHRAHDCPKRASLYGLSPHGDEDASDGQSMGSIRILNAINAKTDVPKVIGKGLQYVKETINSVMVYALVNSGATHNFVGDDEAKWLRINATKESGKIKP